METDKRILDYCGKCLFQSEYHDMGASCYCCDLPNGLCEAIIMCHYYAGDCPYFLDKKLVQSLKKDTILRFKFDGTDNYLKKIVDTKHTVKL